MSSSPRAPGSLRLKLESKSALFGVAVALRTVRYGLERGHVSARNLKRCDADRHDLIATVPLVLLGVIANTLGWAHEQYRYGRTGAFTELDDAGPTSAPLRRRTGSTGEKTLALTFDDGPSEFTSDVLRVLSRYGVPATFFVLGEQVAKMPDVVRSVADAGQGLGIHGWNHTSFTELDAKVLAADLDRAEELLRELTGAECRDIRPPMGFYDRALISRLAGRGLVTWLWTAEASDWLPDATADQIAKKILLSLTPGGIILLHDGGGDRSKTVRALPRVIEGAHARGFRFVALNDLPATPRPPFLHSGPWDGGSQR